MTALTSILAGAGLLAAALFLYRGSRIAASSDSALLGAMRALTLGQTHVRVDPARPGREANSASVFNAMAEAIERREQTLREGSQEDAETGLLTRRALEEALEHVPDRGSGPRYVAALRVDRFTTLRQNIGYPIASNVLRELGARMRSAAPGAPVGRIGTATIGIGFAAADDAAAERWLEMLRTALEPKLDLGGHLLDVTVTTGFAGGDEHAVSCGGLIERAELAADQAEVARSRVAMFRIDEFGDPSERLALMRDLRGALSNGDIFLCFQPKFRSRTNDVDAIEALIRWRHPERGMIPPDQFIALAEETGEIRAVTEWVLKQAARDQARLAAQGLPLAMYVNISGRLLGDRQFAECALQLAANFVGVVGFEITETSVIADPKGALRDLTAFAAAGIRIAIDDYGSGWSSLSYLKQLPAHELKIDRIFISDLSRSQRDPLLVRSTIDLAHALGMEVTAEGVESPSAFALLRVMGCDLVQGYLIARPMPISALETFLVRRDYLLNLDGPVSALAHTETYW
ncbi:MAG: hypothetical protein JWM38_2177 [Sphingomonas bacterium]|nr:hypothetical protein [Sphingomonas bacterium]